MNKPIISISPSAATVILNGRAYTLNATHPQWKAFQEAYKYKNWKKLTDLVSVANAIALYSRGNITIAEGLVTYKGTAVHQYISSMILSFFKEQKPFEPLLAFVEKVMLNPLESARNELFEFLEKGQMPITDDGDFLAYRKVDSDYRSFHANPDGSRNYNRIGDVVEDKNCDTDRNRTCSKGLHFCSYGYLNQYYGGSGRVMIVKINPADVRAIPTDYNLSKGRCVRYEVVAEASQNAEPAADSLREDPLFVLVVADNERKYVPHRDVNGRFAPKDQAPVKGAKRDSRGRFVKA